MFFDNTIFPIFVPGTGIGVGNDVGIGVETGIGTSVDVGVGVATGVALGNGVKPGMLMGGAVVETLAARASRTTSLIISTGTSLTIT